MKLFQKNSLINLWRTIRYNLKIIFAGKFIWFLLASFAFYLFFAIMQVFNNQAIGEGDIYNLIMFPGVLLVFYPSVFGIQNDEDSRILEILFGIPNYRYKVWLVRLIMVFVQVFILLIAYGYISSILLYPVNPFEMAFQLMFPIGFLGAAAFMFSTVIKNGNGTAVVMILIGVALLILSENLQRSQWNIFLNPLELPENFNPIIWSSIVTRNRIFLGVGMVIFLLYGLFNLQKRERFV
ncbi:MAG: hypothetical protein WBK43_10610 [Prolixibacteraceae bacterium]|nr:hypothetical protein [Prolixibacteraceae bacterium]MDI9564009.1 hypothetical protein [Bacteroidota bacterium]NLS99139.1 hypothetical protein [Bacteroidales bacterium]OQB82152.1 MAG: ABC-2 family transporter protein [Bacteroidetes bacterium ADurb.Bin123]HNZ70130.1 hypothetical protein [Prolixibacteraceae bacterium]